MLALAAEPHLTTLGSVTRVGFFLRLASLLLGPRAIRLALLLVGLLLESLRGLLRIARRGLAFLVVGSLLLSFMPGYVAGDMPGRNSAAGASDQRTSMIQKTP